MAQTVLLDVSGVLYQGSRVIPGAVQALSRLRAAGCQVRCLTNSTRQPKRRIMGKLRELGFDIQPEEVFTPVAAALAWLDRTGHSPHLLVHPALEEEFRACKGGGPPAVVVGDAGLAFSYENMNRAFRLLLEGAPFLALADNRVFLDEDGQLSLDAGPFIKALEFASAATPRLFGKPDPEFFRAAVASTGCPPQRAAMIGDDAESDVAGALAAGLAAGYLVRTGKYREGDETRHDPAPTAAVADVLEAVDHLLTQNSL
ncbi:TIGR01458 family HAD-type hydrolase [Leisingera sp. ANG59]|uniref:TIGR01458 family HAD-type hydrolase n=1 Tax=Leisingera sp. ANG59 TaxID=2675221 RepID=UPI001572C18D|nr:TIGR01458 family HAD-type hydrolase [Leisingera sp. ANG59]NSY36911.1 TIGR01458 family HAD-type hydrolase [Leisingera sp. ANG59]